MQLSEWFTVSFDDTHAHRDVRPPGGKPWADAFAFADVERVCIKTGDFLESDELYVFVRSRPESYVIPTEAGGGLDLLNELIRRGLFDAQLAIDAALSTESELHCWPAASPLDEDEQAYEGDDQSAL